jgi:hypothetical protein
MASPSLTSRKRRRVDSDTIAVTPRQTDAASTGIPLEQAQVNANEMRRVRSTNYTEGMYPNSAPAQPIEKALADCAKLLLFLHNRN